MSAWRLSRFSLVAVGGAVVQLIAVHTLVTGAGLNGPGATILAVALAIAHNFVWHWRWTWRDRALPGRALPGAFVRFTLTNGLVSLLGGALTAAVLTSLAPVPIVGANVVAIGLCGLVNYRLADRVAFAPR